VPSNLNENSIVDSIPDSIIQYEHSGIKNNNNFNTSYGTTNRSISSGASTTTGPVDLSIATLKALESLNCGLPLDAILGSEAKQRRCKKKQILKLKLIHEKKSLKKEL